MDVDSLLVVLEDGAAIGHFLIRRVALAVLPVVAFEAPIFEILGLEGEGKQQCKQHEEQQPGTYESHG